MSKVWLICNGYTRQKVAADEFGWKMRSMAEAKAKDAAIWPPETGSKKWFYRVCVHAWDWDWGWGKSLTTSWRFKRQMVAVVVIVDVRFGGWRLNPRMVREERMRRWETLSSLDRRQQTHTLAHSFTHSLTATGQPAKQPART